MLFAVKNFWFFCLFSFWIFAFLHLSLWSDPLIWWLSGCLISGLLERNNSRYCAEFCVYFLSSRFIQLSCVCFVYSLFCFICGPFFYTPGAKIYIQICNRLCCLSLLLVSRSNCKLARGGGKVRANWYSSGKNTWPSREMWAVKQLVDW